LADTRKNQAEAEFKKTQRALDGKKAMSEYEAEAAAVRANMEKLKALRLARDAAEAAAAPAPVAVKKKSGKKADKKARPAGGSLSDWLKDREGSGHNS
jgi:hypothetical protein